MFSNTEEIVAQIFMTQYTGWPKKVSHYDYSTLNRIKTRHCG